MSIYLNNLERVQMVGGYFLLCNTCFQRKGWTFNHTGRRVRAVCAGVFGEKGILEHENVWRSVVDTLQTQQFITVDTNATEEMLVIRKDIYFEKVVTDYTCPYQDFIRLREVLHEIEDAEALAELGIAFCQVPEKLNIKVRVNKGQLADHDLWHSDQATVDLTLRVA